MAQYAVSYGTVERVGKYALVDAAGMIQLATRETRASRLLFCGEIDAPLAQNIAQSLGERAVIAPPAMSARRAGFLAELAWARHQRGEADATESLAPLYAPHESR